MWHVDLGGSMVSVHMCDNDDYQLLHACRITRATQLAGWHGKKAADESGCADKEAECSMWAQEGECEKNQPYMQVYCAKSCKACEAS